MKDTAKQFASVYLKLTGRNVVRCGDNLNANIASPRIARQCERVESYRDVRRVLFTVQSSEIGLFLQPLNQSLN